MGATPSVVPGALGGPVRALVIVHCALLLEFFFLHFRLLTNMYYASDR